MTTNPLAMAQRMRLVHRCTTKESGLSRSRDGIETRWFLLLPLARTRTALFLFSFSPRISFSLPHLGKLVFNAPIPGPGMLLLCSYCYAFLSTIHEFMTGHPPSSSSTPADVFLSQYHPPCPISTSASLSFHILHIILHPHPIHTSFLLHPRLPLQLHIHLLINQSTHIHLIVPSRAPPIHPTYISYRKPNTHCTVDFSTYSFSNAFLVFLLSIFRLRLSSFFVFSFRPVPVPHL